MLTFNSIIILLFCLDNFIFRYMCPLISNENNIDIAQEECTINFENEIKLIRSLTNNEIPKLINVLLLFPIMLNLFVYVKRNKTHSCF
jgi:hypothetical protein